MSETSGRGVVPCLLCLRLCFILAVWGANTWVTRAASGKEGSSGSQVRCTTKPAQKSYRATAPPTPYTDQAKQVSGRKNPAGVGPQQKDKGHLVQQLSAVFERQSANGAASQPPLKSASVPKKGAGAHSAGGSAAAVTSEHPTVPGNSVAGRKCIAKLKHRFETDPNSPPQARIASETKGWESRKGNEGLRSGAGSTNSSKVTSVQATGRSPLGRLFTTGNNSDHSKETPDNASPRAPRIKQLTGAHFCTSPDERASATASGFLEKGSRKVEPTVSKPTSLHRSDPPQCKLQPSVFVGVAASAGHPAQGCRRARRPHALAKWFTRRKNGRDRRPSRKKSGSLARWSARAVSHLCTWAYAPVAISLLSAGVVSKDLLMTIVGGVLLSGGFILNVLSLLGLWFRRIPVTEIIPFTAYNSNLYFGLLPAAYYSVFLLTGYFFVTCDAAFAQSGHPTLVHWGLPMAAVLTAVVALASVPAVARRCGGFRKSRSRGAAVDPESMVSNTEEMDVELIFDFEMFSSHPAEANNGCCGATENTLLAPPCSWISRLARLIRSHLYALFVTIFGASLPLSQGLVRYMESRPSTGSLPLFPVDAPYEPGLPLPYRRGHFASSPRIASLSVTGYLGVAYMLFAIGSAVFRVLRYPAAYAAQLESSTRRKVIFFDYALTFHPFVLGLLMCTMGFLFSYIDSTASPNREFAATVQYAVAFLGVLVALVPTFWITCQCWGARLRDFLREYQETDVPPVETDDTPQLAMSALQDCQTPLEGQHTAASETHDQESWSEWEADDDD